VGPYTKYGEPLFRACAESGTHYVGKLSTSYCLSDLPKNVSSDLTGESPWLALMISRYEAMAQSTGAIVRRLPLASLC
jgi:short subunit dehydrogenase-like uncharacterized protein